MSKKILVICEPIRGKADGIQNHCNDLYNLFLDDKEIDVYKIKDIPYIYLPLIKKKIVKFSSLKRIIKNSQCNIIHIHGFMSIIVAQALLASIILKKKIIYSPHFHPFIYLNRPILGKIFFTLFIKPFLSKINTILTINNEDTSFFSCIHTNVIKIPHWIKKPSTESIKRSSKTNMVLFVGRNEENKGLDHLYSLPINKYEIHCVTNGILERADFIQHSNINNEELENLYNNANVVVIPSRYEAFSYVALESLAKHIPIVISDRVRIADHLKNDNCYTIFKYRNYEDFEKAIDRMLVTKNADFEGTLFPFKKDNIKIIYKKVYSQFN